MQHTQRKISHIHFVHKECQERKNQSDGDQPQDSKCATCRQPLGVRRNIGLRDHVQRLRAGRQNDIGNERQGVARGREAGREEAAENPLRQQNLLLQSLLDQLATHNNRLISRNYLLQREKAQFTSHLRWFAVASIASAAVAWYFGSGNTMGLQKIPVLGTSLAPIDPGGALLIAETIKSVVVGTKLGWGAAAVSFAADLFTGYSGRADSIAQQLAAENQILKDEASSNKADHQQIEMTLSQIREFEERKDFTILEKGNLTFEIFQINAQLAPETARSQALLKDQAMWFEEKYKLQSSVNDRNSNLSWCQYLFSKASSQLKFYKEAFSRDTLGVSTVCQVLVSIRVIDFVARKFFN